MARDPVCGMDIDPEKSGYSATHDGEEYYFCSGDCLLEFEKNPSKYAETRSIDHSHTGHQGHAGGCGGYGNVGAGGNWGSYLHLAVMAFFLLLLLMRVL